MAIARTVAAAPSAGGAEANAVRAAVPTKAADPAIHAEPTHIALAYSLVVGGAVLGWVLWKAFDPVGFQPAPDISAFAVLYVFAQAIERTLEPLTKWAGGVTSGLDKEAAVKRRDEAVEELSGTETPTDIDNALESVAQAQSNVDQVRANLAVVLWGLASLLAMVVCGAFGVLLLEGIGLDVPEWFDLAVTGLAIGSGTKPLHDLISNLQKAKEKKEDPAETK